MALGRRQVRGGGRRGRRVPSGRWRAPVALAAVAAALAAVGSQGSSAVFARETRAVWVVRTDLTSPEGIERVVANCRRAGLNTILAQARGRGDAYYDSRLEPRALSLRDQPDFDPLAEICRDGHRAGMQVHAWLNAMYVWSEPKAPADPGHLVNAHPDWLAVDASGRRLSPGYPDGVFLCPSSPGARQHLCDVVLDVARRYDVDGIHLDYIRYPSARTCFCAGCRKRFNEWLAADGRRPVPAGASMPGTYPAEWQAWRCEQVTSLVAAIRGDLRGARPKMALTAAVIPWGSYTPDFRHSDAYATCGQDWDGWLRGGIVDAVAPMTYQTNTTVFRSWVDGIRRDHPQAQVWFGIGAYLCGPDSAAQKIALVRQSGAAGWCLFSYGAMTKDNSDDAYLRTLSGRLGLVAERR